MLQKISISNECCSFELSIYQITPLPTEINDIFVYITTENNTISQYYCCFIDQINAALVSITDCKILKLLQTPNL